GVISVGASAIQGDSCTSGTIPCDASSGTEMKASYSDYGLTSDGGSPAATVNQPTLLAPGGDPIGGASDLDNLHWIYNLSSTGVPASTGYQCNPAHSGGVCSSFFAGTSQATPHVAGAIALLRSIAPSLGPAQILALLQNPANSDNLNVAGQGAGRLDALKLLQAAGGTSGGSSAPPLGSFVAIAYIAGASNAPTILDQEYTQGVPVNADGTFRLSDIQTSAGYEVGVWLDTNHDGMVDQGDWFGVAGGASSPSRYTATGAYNYGTIVVQQVGASFVLQ
ncbi:MAG: S8 family serine peptidase, partial [bacterium]|nr:S8 family serine peptidase [bacterium]